MSYFFWAKVPFLRRKSETVGTNGTKGVRKLAKDVCPHDSLAGERENQQSKNPCDVLLRQKECLRPRPA